MKVWHWWRQQQHAYYGEYSNAIGDKMASEAYLIVFLWLKYFDYIQGYFLFYTRV